MSAADCLEKGSSLFVGSGNRMKYQEESTNVSIVSVSRLAGPLQLGHLQLTHSSILSKGLPVCPLIEESRGGSRTGRSSLGTATVPHVEQCTIGIGVPQYLCRLTSQSRSLQVSTFSARPCRLKSETIFVLASLLESPA